MLVNIPHFSKYTTRNQVTNKVGRQDIIPNGYLADAKSSDLQRVTAKGGEKEMVEIEKIPEDISKEWLRPWKCRKCNIIFLTENEAVKHLTETSFIEPHPDPNRIGGGTTFFHVVVDKNGDDMLYGKHFGSD
jgi:hypothetical protein